MPTDQRATRIQLFDLHSPQMRAFHLSWFAFFLCFFAWFGIAPFMPLIREEMQLSQAQVGNLVIASVAFTVFARLGIGWACDRFGPRLTYSCLLVLGSLPVMGVGLAQSYQALLVFRCLIGVIGAAFVITQYHTSLMFAPNCVGTANATTAGWGNLGGGVTNMVMPLIAAGFIWFGLDETMGWRAAMVVAGAVCALTGIAYFFLTQDTPEGNLAQLRRQGGERVSVPLREVVSDYRVWLLFLAYAACFGIELTINGIAAMYFFDHFELDLATAGRIAGLFGLMNLFARTLGGFFGDRLGRRYGLRGRVRWLVVALIAEGIALCCFSQLTLLPVAVAALIVFSLFVQMSEGATYGVVPFINRRGLGLVAGIVGAGGNVGAVAAGFLYKSTGDTAQMLLILGGCVIGCGLLVSLLRFRSEEEQHARHEMVSSITASVPAPVPASA